MIAGYSVNRRIPIAAGLAAVAIAVSPCVVSEVDGFGSAQAATVQVQAAESGGTVSMPRGDFASRTADGLHETPRLSPTPAGELRRIKESGGLAGQAAAADPALAAAPRAVLKNCAMQSSTGFAPSDVHGAVSPTNLIEVTNVDIHVRRKSDCGLVSAMSLKNLFGGGFTIPATETLFDPRVLYDRLSGRCIVTVESRNSGNSDQFLYVASSRTSTCTTWRLVRFVLSRVNPAGLFCKQQAGDFYDYPNAGYNRYRVAVTANYFRGGAYVYASLISIDKVALHGIATVFAKCFRTGLPSNMTPAVVGDLATAMFILSPGSGGGSIIRRHRLNPVGSGAGLADTLTATTNINIPAWTAGPDAAQPNGRRLDVLDGRFQSASKQIGSVIWNVHTVRSGNFARWRMYKLSTTGTGVLFTRTPTTATCSNVDHLFNPSIDTNSAATTALAFVTASRTCPSQATAGRAAHLIFRGQNASNTGWVFNTIATSTTQFTNAGGTSCNSLSGGACRWGDYSSTQIDPSSVATGWGFNQLVTGTSQFTWGTRAGRVN